MWEVAGPSEYLAITGSGIRDIKVAKKAWIWPLQKCVCFDISPVNYSFQVQAMSVEKLPFTLPAVFTIGPRVDDPRSLLLYAGLLSPHEKLSNHVNELVQGIIEGETRVLAASMKMEEIFKGSKEFKRQVFEQVQVELNQFGMWIYNANVKELVDVAGHEYFSFLGQKTQMEAANQAKVDVAEAKMKGETGAKLREGQTAQNAAKINTETMIISTQMQGEGKKEEIKVTADLKIYENEKEAEVAEANAKLATNKAGWGQAYQLAEVESVKAVAISEAELQAEVERKNALTKTERLKAEFLSKASVDYDIKVQEANWKMYQKQRAADAILYEKENEAKAQKVIADAKLYACQRAAEGELYMKMKEAEGIVALAKAKAFYSSSLLKQLAGNYGALRDYIMLDKNMFRDIAMTNAQAVNGLQPKISIWNWNNVGNGDGGEEANSAVDMNGIAGVCGMLPPLFKN